MANRIPQRFIEDLLARIDIVDVIDGYVPLRKAGKNHQARCPFHDEKTPSFTVSQDKQFYHCFGCGANGTAISFLMEYSRLSFPEAVQDLANRCGLTIPQEEGYTPAGNANAELYELLEQCVKYYETQLRQHSTASRAVDYLKQRGISGEIAAAYELGYAPPGWENLLQELGQSAEAQQQLQRVGMIITRDSDSGHEGHYDRFRERIMYPIRDQRGRAIGFGGRAIGDENPKYLNSPETPVFHKGRELYGLHQARQQHRNLERLYLVEGYMDVIALAQYGIHNAVATLGTAATADQIQRLFRHSGQLVFCFDGDEAGKKAAWRALENTLPQLSEGREARFMFMPEGDDPDSYVRQHGAESFLDDKQYLPLSDFLLDGLQAGSDPDSREGRAKLLDAVLPFINKLPRSGLREILIGDVALRCKVERQVLEDMLKGLPDKQRRPVGRPVRPAPRKGDELVGNLVSCLLYRPALAALVEEVESLRDIPVDGVNFLIDLLDFIHQSPDTNCAAIVENWRDTPYHERLNALAAGLSVYDEDGFDIERLFRDTLTKLQGKRLQQEIAAKAGKGLKDLSEADKEALRKGIASLKST